MSNYFLNIYQEAIKKHHYSYDEIKQSLRL